MNIRHSEVIDNLSCEKYELIKFNKRVLSEKRNLRLPLLTSKKIMFSSTIGNFSSFVGGHQDFR